MKTCIIGIGNSWATDDGIGREVIQQLQEKYASKSPVPPNTILFGTFLQPSVELINLMGQCDTLILVDAVYSGAKPGTIHREVWRPGLLSSRGVERASSHGLSVKDVLELAATMGQLPEQIILWGVEVASTEPGQGLSPEVEAALPTVVDQLAQELESQLTVNAYH